MFRIKRKHRGTARLLAYIKGIDVVQANGHDRNIGARWIG